MNMKPSRRKILQVAASAAGLSAMPRLARAQNFPSPCNIQGAWGPNGAPGGYFLRMDGSGVTSFKGNGGGTVNSQNPAGPWELFNIVVLPDQTVSIASVAFPNVFLRMDGRGVTSFSANGGGTVNCQYTAGSWERFNIGKQPDGTYNIGSAAFPNVFLRMEEKYGVGSDIAPRSSAGGFGKVNCQYTAGRWESFLLIPSGG